MRVGAFVHLHRTLHKKGQTGAGKHIDNLVPRLAAFSDIDLTVLAARDNLAANGQIPPESSLAGMPTCPIRWPRRWVEICWSIFDFPAIERWSGRLDWVYCPVEAYIATRSARLAVTLHTVHWFEKDLPGYQSWALRRSRWVFTPRFARMRRHADALFTVSEFLSWRLARLCGFPFKRLVVVGNGVEEAYYDPPNELNPHLANLIAGRPYLLVVGELQYLKGIDHYLALAAELRRRNSDLMIVVAGDTDDHNRQILSECSNIVQLGYVGIYDGLPALMKCSVALLFLSRYETFGIPAAEAMAAGTPAVVSTAGALPEVVGNAGLIVDPNRTAEIADIVSQLHQDERFRNEWIARGRQRAESFRWQRCAERVREALRNF